VIDAAVAMSVVSASIRMNPESALPCRYVFQSADVRRSPGFLVGSAV
jgi:hypothetical protein